MHPAPRANLGEPRSSLLLALTPKQPDRADPRESGADQGKGGLLWKEALSTHEERSQLERAICATKAKTPLGAIARMQLWMDVWGDKTEGTVWELPHAAIRDAMAILERPTP